MKASHNPANKFIAYDKQIDCIWGDENTPNSAIVKSAIFRCNEKLPELTAAKRKAINLITGCANRGWFIKCVAGVPHIFGYGLGNLTRHPVAMCPIHK